MALTLSEQFTLRALTARVIGEAINELLPGKWGFVTGKNYICSSLVGGLEATLLSKQAGLTLTKTLVLEEGQEPTEEFLLDLDSVFLAFGGESSAEQNYAWTLATLKQLAKVGFEGDIFFHVRIWVPGFVEKAVLADESIAELLVENPALWTFTFDLDKGLFVVGQPHFSGDEIHFHPVKEIPITHQHLELLKASL